MTLQTIENIGFSFAEKEVMVGRFWQNKTYRQIAAENDIKRDSVKKRMYRARQRARKRDIEIPTRLRTKIQKSAMQLNGIENV